MEAAVKIENLRLSFHGPLGKVEAVKGVDLQVAAGETVALVGESGCGKTALCRSILRLHAEHARIDSGNIFLCGRDVTCLSEKEMEKVRGVDAAMVFQDPMTSLNPVFSVGRQIMEPMLIHEKVSRQEAKKRALELLRKVGISEPEIRFSQYPHHFSGGMRQRVAIAIALACNPRLFIADEPTTALDSQNRKQIVELLRNLCSDGKRGVLFVTHDLALARTIADRIAVMKDGVIVETGTAEEIFSFPRHDYTKKLIWYALYGTAESHYHGSVREVKNESVLQPPMLAVRGLSKSFSLRRGKVQKVLDDFSMTVAAGEIVGLVGPSGCGKSTLARCLMGIYPPDAGRIEFAEDCGRQMIFQDSASAFNPRMKLWQIIGESLLLQCKKKKQLISKEELKKKVYEMMEQVELEPALGERYPYDVSGGQRQRAAIARALMTEPDFIIADEPVSSLDVSTQSQIIHLLKKLHDQRNLTLILISHDLPMVEHISDRIIDLGKR